MKYEIEVYDNLNQTLLDVSTEAGVTPEQYIADVMNPQLKAICLNRTISKLLSFDVVDMKPIVDAVDTAHLAIEAGKLAMLPPVEPPISKGIL